MRSTMGSFLVFVFYYLVFTPLALILKISGAVFLNLGFDLSKETYWIKVKKNTSFRQSMRKLY